MANITHAMKIVRAIRCGERGGHEALDIHFSNGYTLRVMNDGEGVYLFPTPPIAPGKDPIQAIDDIAGGQEQSFLLRRDGETYEEVKL